MYRGLGASWPKASLTPDVGEILKRGGQKHILPSQTPKSKRNQRARRNRRTPFTRPS